MLMSERSNISDYEKYDNHIYKISYLFVELME